MSRKWEHDDVVAMVTPRHPGDREKLGTRLGFRRDTGGWSLLGGGYVYDNDQPLVRSLLVVDPEDHDQMEKLGREWDALGDAHAELMGEPWSMNAMRMRQTFRAALALPPKEPDRSARIRFAGSVDEFAFLNGKWTNGHGRWDWAELNDLGAITEETP